MGVQKRVTGRRRPTRREPTPEEQALAELRAELENALQKNPPMAYIRQLRGTAEHAAAVTRERLAVMGKTPGKLSPQDRAQLNAEMAAKWVAFEEGLRSSFSGEEWLVVERYKKAVRATGKLDASKFTTQELHTIHRYVTSMNEFANGITETPPRPDEHGGQPSGGGGGSETLPPKPEGGGLAKVILATVGAAALTLLTAIGGYRLIKTLPPAGGGKTTVQTTTSIPPETTTIPVSSTTTVPPTPTTVPTTTTVRTTSTTTIRRIPYDDALEEQRKRAAAILEKANNFYPDFRGCLNHLVNYAQKSGARIPLISSYYDELDELVTGYKEKNKARCKTAVKQLGARWETILLAGGGEGPDRTTWEELNRVPLQILTVIKKRFIDPM